MSKVLTNNKYYSEIANVIREQNGTNNTYKPAQMVSALKDLFYEEVEGVPPISFNGIGENLLDYRIDGASGGVGDRTSNLVDKTKFMYGYRLSNTGTLYTTPSEQKLFAVSEFIKVNSGEQYIISQRDATRGYARRISFYQSKNENSWLSNNDDSDLIFTVPNTATYLKFTTMQNYIDSIMLIRGTSLPTTYEPYGYKVPIVVSGKNLFDGDEPFLNSNTDTKAQMDIWFRLYNTSNLSISAANAVSNAQINQRIERVVTPNSDYNRLVVKHNGKTQDIIIISKVLEAGKNYVVSFDIKNNDVQTVGGIEISNIQIEEGSTATDYEPYHEPTTTNIYLDEPIGANESISLSDTNINIPTIRGTNILTVDTTVQPSNVYIKARKESSYETAMREEYEQELSNIESALEEV